VKPEIKIKDYSYHLPDHRIAKYPLSVRDESRLLIWKNRQISEDKFSKITKHLPSGSFLVFNNTRVIHARLYFRKETGPLIEIFCLEPIDPADYQMSFSSKGPLTWKCLVGNSKKWKEGNLTLNVDIREKKISLIAKKKGRMGDAFEIEFQWNGDAAFAEVIDCAGKLPIPPYLKRESEPIDEITYQTIFARFDGSVAAPTAGLHFTEKVLNELSEKSISTAEITLHVGAGTFQPVKSNEISSHEMHHEKVAVTRDFIQKLICHKGKIIAVGTTSVRSLESLYWLAVKLKHDKHLAKEPEIRQWEPYSVSEEMDLSDALNRLLEYMLKNELDTIRFSTQIIIVPGYTFRLVEGMITNFHQPQSTLLLLIASFIGSDWRKTYDYALENGFRFLSYGDSNLYLK
jgi:S-adenosylmethionine:tRNA ribosyltransferase-isomerase